MKRAPLSSSNIYGLSLLTLVAMLSVMDRSVIAVIQEPIRHEFNLSDSALGLLSGLAFAIPYILVGLPFGIIADRVDRTRLLAGALSFWSIATAVCGLSASFIQLLAARIAVASGEAAGGPAQQSLVADLFTKERRGTALGFYHLSMPIGVILAMLIGGVVGERYGWRAAFIVAGIPGLLLSLLILLTMRAPPRGHVDGKRARPPAVRETARFIISQRSLLHVIAGMVLGQLAIGANGAWMPSFFVRQYQLDLQQLGVTLAWVKGLTGVAGIFLGGLIADKAGRLDPRGSIWVIIASLMMICPTTLLTIHMTQANAAFAAYGLYLATSLIWIAGASALVQNLAGPARRATVTAFSMMLVGLLGSGLAPWASGALSDAFRPYAGQDALRWSLAFFCCFGFWGAAHMFAASRSYLEDLERAEEPVRA